jgi:rhodanese-related sulfurtransferase
MQPGPVTIQQLLDEARARLDRVPPELLESEHRAGALVVDTRSVADREAEGAYPGAVVIERTVLEWRLAPSSPSKAMTVPADRRVIVLCNDGYSSSLAAATLQRLGLVNATDVVGGYRAWRALGRPEPSQRGG